jgi:hypothetical protein
VSEAAGVANGESIRVPCTGESVNDELKKLGLRIRPRTVGGRKEQPGKIKFDERGNAIYAWSAGLAADDEDGEQARRHALDHPGLSMMEEEPVPTAPIRNNPGGLRLGYNPYESGLLVKKEWKKKRDLRELSKWLEIKRKLVK